MEQPVCSSRDGSRGSGQPGSGCKNAPISTKLEETDHERMTTVIEEGRAVLVRTVKSIVTSTVVVVRL